MNGMTERRYAEMMRKFYLGYFIRGMLTIVTVVVIVGTVHMLPGTAMAVCFGLLLLAVLGSVPLLRKLNERASLKKIPLPMNSPGDKILDVEHLGTYQNHWNAWRIVINEWKRFAEAERLDAWYDRLSQLSDAARQFIKVTIVEEYNPDLAKIAYEDFSRLIELMASHPLTNAATVPGCEYEPVNVYKLSGAFLKQLQTANDHRPHTR